MYSGKTSELIRLVDRNKYAGKKCLIIKYDKDLRFDDMYVTTHSQVRYKNCDIIHFAELSDAFILELIVGKKYNLVAIEEGQFFLNLSHYCSLLADNFIDVIVSALDGNYKQELFKEVGNLIPKAENVIKLSAVCMECQNKDGCFTIRTNNMKEEIVIGGEEMYKSVCRDCLKNFRNLKEIIIDNINDLNGRNLNTRENVIIEQVSS